MAAPETPSSPPSSPGTAYFDSDDASPCSSPCSSGFPSTSPSSIVPWCDVGPQYLTQDLLAHGADELHQLHNVQAQLSSTSTEDEGLALHEKKVAANASARHNRYWFFKMKSVMREIDHQTNCIPRKDPLRFLDLGCSPGGFTSYILSKNLFAQGHGISSEIEHGGHRFLLEDRHRARFKISYADLAYYRLGPLPAPVASAPASAETPMRSLAALPFDTNKRFDLVLLDGYPLRHTPDADRRLVAQLIVGLQYLKTGGKLIIKLAEPAHAATAKLLFMLDGLSSSGSGSAEARGLTTYKPYALHATRSTFYAIAQGVGAACPELPILIEKLKDLWVDLTIGGEDGTGRPLCEEDLDFVVTTKELQQPAHLARLAELGRRVWEVQGRALAGIPEPPLVCEQVAASTCHGHGGDEAFVPAARGIVVV
ncbi:FtsJ domain-containing protein [Mycena kentingensis (nom. inval.)]|nr:FtsJ domain-containing protein [Mycena kentingensis (nom. inval.)]